MSRHSAMLVGATSVVLAACVQDPAHFPARLEQALASGSPARVEALLSRTSRPLYAAMVASRLHKDGPFALHPPRSHVEVVAVEPGEASALVTVRAGGVTRKWGLVQEDGAWRLDLTATSTHRRWSDDSVIQP